MKIKDIRAGMDGITVTGCLTKMGEKREVETRFGKALTVATLLEDDTGRIILNLWRDQIDLVKVGDIVRIENGFVRTFRDQLELNVGSRGKIIVLTTAEHTHSNWS